MLWEVGIRNSSPPLSKPHLPQNFEVQPFPLPALPRPDIPVGRRLAHYVEQWEELTDNKWVLSIIRNGFKIPFKSVPPLSGTDKSESIFLPIIARRNRGASQETGSGKGSEYENSPFLFLAIPNAKKERKVTPSNRSFLTKSVYKQTACQDGDNQVSKTIDNGQRLGYLHRSDGCISSCINTSDVQKIPSVHPHPSGISVHSLTIWNVSKSLGFHKINECYSSTLTSMCRISLPIPRWLANKRSDSQSTYLSHKILPTVWSNFIWNGGWTPIDLFKECPFILQIPKHSFIQMPVITDGELIWNRWVYPFMVAGRKTSPSYISTCWK